MNDAPVKNDRLNKNKYFVATQKLYIYLYKSEFNINRRLKISCIFNKHY